MRALRLAVLALVGTALPLSFYFGFVRPDRVAAIERAEQRLETRQKEIPALEGIAARLSEFQREQQVLQERLALLEQIRPASRDPGPLLDGLRALASAEGLNEVSVEDLSPGTDDPTLPVRLRAQGAPSALVSLLGRLPRFARMVRLERIELERLEKGRYELVLHLVAFRDTTPF